MAKHRPEYESDFDRMNQSYIARKIKEKFGIDLFKTPRFYCYDYAALNRKGEIIGMLEVKARKPMAYKHNSYMISLDKLSKCKAEADFASGKPHKINFVLFVGYRDRIVYWVFDENQFTIGINGRDDRSDAQDYEPVAYIPMKYFKELYIYEDA